jgi:spore germination cell wall hydrolase CwlJ-like protein
MEFSIKTVYRLLGLLFVVFLVNLVTTYKLGSLKELIIDKPKSYVSVENVDRVLDCLAMNIYKEASGESFEGKVAVAQVTLNRYNHPSFPKDICKVITQKNVIMDKVVCQFSWYCNGYPTNKPRNKAYEESYAVAKKVLLEGFKLDSLKDALYYHAVYVKPQWPYERITQIGNHIFYRNRT